MCRSSSNDSEKTASRLLSIDSFIFQPASSTSFSFLKRLPVPPPRAVVLRAPISSPTTGATQCSPSLCSITTCFRESRYSLARRRSSLPSDPLHLHFALSSAPMRSSTTFTRAPSRRSARTSPLSLEMIHFLDRSECQLIDFERLSNEVTVTGIREVVGWKWGECRLALQLDVVESVTIRAQSGVVQLGLGDQTGNDLGTLHLHLLLLFGARSGVVPSELGGDQ